MQKKQCPFKVGDTVIFSPSEHTRGWYQHAWDKLRIKPGDQGIITRIDQGVYVYLDDNRGGFFFDEYKLASQK
jgi:hypothetical protein